MHSLGLTADSIMLSEQLARLKSVRSSLSPTIRDRDGIEAAFRRAIQSASDNVHGARQLSSSAMDAAQQYRAAEAKIVFKANIRDLVDLKDIWRDVQNVGAFAGLTSLSAGAAGTVTKGKISRGISRAVSGKILGLDSKGSASLNFLNHDREKHGGAKYKTGEDGTIASVEYSIKDKASVIKGEVKGNIGRLGGDASVELLTAACTGAVGATIYKDGKFAPSVYARAKVEAAAAKGEANVKYGSDQFDVHAKAEGTALGADAEAKAGLGLITYKDSSGNMTTAVGVEGKVGAEAYVAQGSIKGGFKVFGIDVDVKATGTAAGVGVSAGGSITTNGVHGKIGGALGLGAGLEVSIDWSKFKYKFW